MPGYENSFAAWPFALAATIIIATWCRYIFVMLRRKKEMRAMAMRLGLQQWPDDSIPRDLALDTTAFKHWSKLFNVYEGILNGHQVAVFDLRKKAGKSSYSRTILAVRSNENLLNGTAFELEKTQVDKWQLAYLPTGFLIRSQLMEVADIEESLKFIECI